MCGITAYVGDGDVTERLLSGLENLEYRGYDSAGIALETDDELLVRKREGELPQLKAVLGGVSGGTVGIGHTRWSTHGEPSDRNAHPHQDCTGRVAVVHNGVIENYHELREELSDEHRFTSETDTEVVPHLIETELDAGRGPEAAFHRAIERLEGSFAIATVIEGTEQVFATRTGSPLVLGLDGAEAFLASDVPAFLEYTDEVVYLQDGDVVIVDEDGWEVTDRDGESPSRGRTTVEWTAEDAERQGYDHYMLKEINEQPDAIDRTLGGRLEGDCGVSLADLPAERFEEVSEIQFVGCGTSYHAALYAQCLFHQCDVPTTVYRAGEYATSPAPVTEDTLTVGVTQSGETADTLQSLRTAKAAGAQTLAVTNVIGSTAARECDDALFIRAGPEIGVAATKTFSSQVVTLALLARRFASLNSLSVAFEGLPEALGTLPGKLRTVIEDDSVSGLVSQYAAANSYFFIGRGVGWPVALEGALKFKEITYEHAEGFAAGELKHGPLALVTENTPVFAVFTGNHTGKTLQNVEEIQARGAPVIGITSATADRVQAQVDSALTFPEAHPMLAGVLANAYLQRISYRMAHLMDRPIDKPRNLAKSVTVE
jgi:glucosamine--fructose-6-phosphate aminotransferase (isomerizing)